MDPQTTQASPATDNSPAQALAEGNTGDFLDGVIGITGNSGKATPDGATQQGSESVASPATNPPAPLAKDTDSSVKPWMKQLQAELQTNEGLSRFQNISELGKSYLELEGKLGKSVAIPDKNATPEEWNAYYQRVGRPESPEKYALEKPKEIPEGVVYSDAATKSFRDMAFGLGLTQSQANTMYSQMVAAAVEQTKAQKQARANQSKLCESTLRDGWGQKYDANIENVKRLVSGYADEKTVALIKERGLSSSPEFMQFLAKIGGEHREDQLVGGTSGNAPKEEKGFSYPGL